MKPHNMRPYKPQTWEEHQKELQTAQYKITSPNGESVIVNGAQLIELGFESVSDAIFELEGNAFKTTKL